MKGHFEDKAGGVAPAEAVGAGVDGVYQDVHGIKWTIAKNAAGNWSASATADNAYGLTAGNVIGASNAQAGAVDTVDEWVDLWDTDKPAAMAQVKGAKPAPASPSTASDSGLGVLFLIVIVALAMSDKRKR